MIERNNCDPKGEESYDIWAYGQDPQNMMNMVSVHELFLMREEIDRVLKGRNKNENT